jgi:hypothetical protein
MAAVPYALAADGMLVVDVHGTTAACLATTPGLACMKAPPTNLPGSWQADGFFYFQLAHVPLPPAFVQDHISASAAKKIEYLQARVTEERELTTAAQHVQNTARQEQELAAQAVQALEGRLVAAQKALAARDLCAATTDKPTKSFRKRADTLQAQLVMSSSKRTASRVRQLEHELDQERRVRLVQQTEAAAAAVNAKAAAAARRRVLQAAVCTMQTQERAARAALLAVQQESRGQARLLATLQTQVQATTKQSAAERQSVQALRADNKLLRKDAQVQLTALQKAQRTVAQVRTQLRRVQKQLECARDNTAEMQQLRQAVTEEAQCVKLLKAKADGVVAMQAKLATLEARATTAERQRAQLHRLSAAMRERVVQVQKQSSDHEAIRDHDFAARAHAVRVVNECGMLARDVPTAAVLLATLQAMVVDDTSGVQPPEQILEALRCLPKRKPMFQTRGRATAVLAFVDAAQRQDAAFARSSGVDAGPAASPWAQVKPFMHAAVQVMPALSALLHQRLSMALWSTELHLSFMDDRPVRERNLFRLRAETQASIVHTLALSMIDGVHACTPLQLLHVLHHMPVLLTALADDADVLDMTDVERDVAVSHLTAVWCALFLPQHLATPTAMTVRTRLAPYAHTLALVIPCTSSQSRAITTILHMVTSLCVVGGNMRLQQHVDEPQLHLNVTTTVTNLMAQLTPLDCNSQMGGIVGTIVAAALEMRAECECWQRASVVKVMQDMQGLRGSTTVETCNDSVVRLVSLLRGMCARCQLMGAVKADLCVGRVTGAFGVPLLTPKVQLRTDLTARDKTVDRDDVVVHLPADAVTHPDLNRKVAIAEQEISACRNRSALYVLHGAPSGAEEYCADGTSAWLGCCNEREFVKRRRLQGEEMSKSLQAVLQHPMLRICKTGNATEDAFTEAVGAWTTAACTEIVMGLCMLCTDRTDHMNLAADVWSQLEPTVVGAAEVAAQSVTEVGYSCCSPWLARRKRRVFMLRRESSTRRLNIAAGIVAVSPLGSATDSSSVVVVVKWSS